MWIIVVAVGVLASIVLGPRETRPIKPVFAPPGLELYEPPHTLAPTVIEMEQVKSYNPRQEEPQQ